MQLTFDMFDPVFQAADPELSIANEGTFAVYSRGAWFSAGTHIAITNLQINHSFTVSFWVKPYNFQSIFGSESDQLTVTSGYVDDIRKFLFLYDNEIEHCACMSTYRLEVKWAFISINAKFYEGKT